MLIQTLEMAGLLQIKNTKNKPLDFSVMIGMANRRSYNDRLEKVGDPQYTNVPINEMISQEYIKDLPSDIDTFDLSENYRKNLDSDADIENHENS